MNTLIDVPTVNYHLWKPCNMGCEFCFATFADIGPETIPKGHLGREGCFAIATALAEAGFEKINFAGGEPTLCPWLPELVAFAKGLGLATSVVTNGTRITHEWVEGLDHNLDWAAISIDSVDQSTLKKTGRATVSGPMSEADYRRTIDILQRNDVRVKVNTVVTKANLDEDLTNFIVKARPARWKLFQVLPVGGQNDYLVGPHVVSSAEFDRYVERAERVESYGIAVVPENNDLMTGSYVMVDPAGRFFDNVLGHHTYSRPILEVGVIQAIADVSVDFERFLERDGLYDWQREPVDTHA